MPRSIPAPTAHTAACLSRHWIFGYGSLAHVESLKRFLAHQELELGAHGFGTLAGFRRSWSAAMDNALTLPGYKYYLDAATGERPQVFVAFANIEREPQAQVSGILFEADVRMLELLDTRERNYHRTDVTAHVEAQIDGTVWTYIGSPEAGARYRQGLQTNRLVLDKSYVESIETAFARARLPYNAPLPPNVPIVELTRVDT